ncbi:hypothetical protein Pla123a_10620 [Posidoniimonas polymericola]|uniref:Uncharacterized protein n=1 Tax=Posidoniimonas polymericola TaxID=2528002 RepID=A0A5C5YTY4_9BACT|nr:hypothetical protein [Posidoniimonas polymericola]TWT78271.1 hypothetical protein Pla123a_10620 [Posidoniimonas polymericola]
MTATPPPPSDNPIAPLGREEYVEQAHFFGSLAARLRENIPAQEVLKSVREEVLATTRLPMAIDFMLSELRHAGAFGTAMSKLPHYFTPFQAFIINQAEDERGRFDLRVGLEVLRRDAEYRAGDSTGDAAGHPPMVQGLFLFQFEVLCRNRLPYDRGLGAMAEDASFSADWREWILRVRRQVGMVDIADLIYVNSEHYATRQARASRGEEPPAQPTTATPLFGDREGRIALANRKKDPVYLFNSLHRQLGYPEAPRHSVVAQDENPLPQIARRLEQLEKRMSLMEEEQRGGIDLSKLYQPPPGR